MIKKILTVLAVTFAMANSFAYEGFRFDDSERLCSKDSSSIIPDTFF